MFERFTDRARRVVVLAQEEARALHHNYIGTEHILLGLIRESDGVAAQALEALGVGLDSVRLEVEGIIGKGDPAQEQSGHIPFTPRAKKVLELSLREAKLLGHHYIGTEHILLGLLREGEGVAAVVLVKLGSDLNTVRQQVIMTLRGHHGAHDPLAPPAHMVVPRLLPLSEVGAHLDALAARLEAIEERLAAIETHLGVPPRPKASPAAAGGAAGEEAAATESATPAASPEPGVGDADAPDAGTESGATG